MAGLITSDHLGYINQTEPQMATQFATLLYQANYGVNLLGFLNQFKKKTLESDDDWRWMLQGASRKNIPLIECRIGGTAITATSRAGLANARFDLVFGERLFSQTSQIVGEKGSTYPILIVGQPTPEGSNWVYTCELATGDPDLYLPYDDAVAGKRFSYDFAPVEYTLSKKGATPNYASPFSMRNSFTQIRMENTVPGNMKRRPVKFPWKVVNPDTGKEEIKQTWMDYADWELEIQFQQAKNHMLRYSVSNKKADGTYHNRGLSGNVIRQGSGLEEQLDSGNRVYYSDFDLDIEWLTEHVMDLSDNNSTYGDQRRVLMVTGKWGAYNFHKAIKDYTQLYTPLRNEQMIYSVGSKFGYNEGFMEYNAPDGCILSVLVDPSYDDTVRNKIMHPSGHGVAKSYQYDILNVGKVGGEDNIMLVEPSDADVMAYVAGIRSPFSPDNKMTGASDPTDGWTVHRMYTGGVQVTDPSRVARIIPNVLA